MSRPRTKLFGGNNPWANMGFGWIQKSIAAKRRYFGSPQGLPPYLGFRAAQYALLIIY